MSAQHAPDGHIPPNQAMLGGLMGEVLHFAARQVRSQCSNTEQAATLLQDLAAVYEEDAVERWGAYRPSLSACP